MNTVVRFVRCRGFDVYVVVDAVLRSCFRKDRWTEAGNFQTRMNTYLGGSSGRLLTLSMTFVTLLFFASSGRCRARPRSVFKFFGPFRLLGFACVFQCVLAMYCTCGRTTMLSMTFPTPACAILSIGALATHFRRTTMLMHTSCRRVVMRRIHGSCGVQATWQQFWTL